MEKRGQNKVLIISVEDEHEKYIMELFQKSCIPFEVYAKKDYDTTILGKNISRRVAMGGISVVVAPNQVAHTWKKHLSIPLLVMTRDYYDYLCALRQAREITTDNKIALVLWDFHTLREFYQFEKDYCEKIHIKFLDPSAQSSVHQREFVTKNYLKALQEQGYEVIIGNGMVYSSASELGFHTLRIQYSTESLQKLIEEVRYQMRIYDLQQETLETLRCMFNGISEGIIVTNPQGIVLEANQIAAKFFKIKDESFVLQKPLSELLPSPFISASIEKEEPIVNHILSVHHIDIVINSFFTKIQDSVQYCIFTIHEITQVLKMDQEIQVNAAKKGLYAKLTFQNIIGESSSITALKKKAERFAKADSTILILGETGTGKEVFAQSIHNGSLRKNYPFVAINCAALPQDLLESELFGYVKGAFTGAKAEGKAGIFESAHRGTIFLDEISEISLHAQARLLRVLQEREVSRIGDNRVIPVDVRILAASNQNLYTLTRNGKFRDDLYYRLCVLKIIVPPLRDRVSDISRLLQNFLDKWGASQKYFSLNALHMLETYEWPGNIRELENFVERVVLSVDEDRLDELTVAELLYDEGAGIPTIVQNSQRVTVELELAYILKILNKNGGSKQKTAQELGISTSTLWRKLKNSHDNSTK